MSDEPERQDLEDRVDQLESTISKMLPGRRDALKLGGAALVGGAAMSGSASAGTSQAGTIGTAFVCPSTGIYYAKAKANFESGSVGDFRQLAIGNGSNFAPFGEGSRLIDNNSSPNDEVEVATMNKYASGDTISAYATNLNSSDSLEPGRGNFGTHLEVVFLGSL